MWSCQSRLVWSSRKLCWTLWRLSDFSPETTRQRIKCMHCDLMNQGVNPANWPTRLREDIQLNTASPSVQRPPKRNSRSLYLAGCPGQNGIIWRLAPSFVQTESPKLRLTTKNNATRIVKSPASEFDSAMGSGGGRMAAGAASIHCPALSCVFCVPNYDN